MEAKKLFEALRAAVEKNPDSESAKNEKRAAQNKPVTHWMKEVENGEEERNQRFKNFQKPKK